MKDDQTSLFEDETPAPARQAASRDECAPTSACAPWLPASHPAVNADCDRRIVALPEDERWTSTPDGLLELRILEYLPAEDGRLTALCRRRSPATPVPLNFCANTELLVQDGTVTCGAVSWPAGCYVRRPDCAGEMSLLRAADTARPATSSESGSTLVYFTTGQLADTDTEYRDIDTTDAELWLPGPVEGVEVMALHGHGSSTAMLVRWLQATTFQPRLDPVGEEILVLQGCLHDASGDYPPGSWIRNPIPAWQSWRGEPGTLILYKSGHFFSTASDAATLDG